MKRLLLASYYFPPHLLPESLLSARTVKSLVRAGWDITVLTNREHVPWIKTDGAFLESMPESVLVKRVGGLEHVIKREKVLKLLYALGLPEFEALWIPSAILAGRRMMRQQPFDVIHSWACCHTSNVVGLMLKREAGIPWIAHLSDPWVDNPYYRPTARQAVVWRRLEEAVMREADAVVFTTEETVDLVMKKYPASWRGKAVVVPHGYDADFAAYATSGRLAGNRLRFAYTGGFYGARTPDWLLRALILLKERAVKMTELEVVFVGPIDDRFSEMAARMGLAEHVTFTGQLAFTESLQQAANADVLLVIDAPSDTGSVFLPSKLVDYLMFEKPILGLTPQQGASASLLRQLDCPVVSPDDVEGIASIVEKMLEQWRAGGLKVSDGFAAIARRYHIDQTTRILTDCLDACLEAEEHG